MKNKMFSCSKTTNYFCIILVIIPRAIYRLAVKAIAQLVATADLRRLVNARSIALFLRKKIPQSYNPIDYYSKKKVIVQTIRQFSPCWCNLLNPTQFGECCRIRIFFLSMAMLYRRIWRIVAGGYKLNLSPWKLGFHWRITLANLFTRVKNLIYSRIFFTINLVWEGW